jgi:hypothetical protein
MFGGEGRSLPSDPLGLLISRAWATSLATL